MFSTRAKRIILAMGIAVVIAGGVVVAVQTGAWTRWRVRAYVARAESLARSGAKDSARMASMKALALDRDSVAATRALLSVVPENALPQALFLRVRIADLDPKDHANLRELAQSAIMLQRLDLAETATRDLERATGKTADVLELRARIPAAQSDFAAALKAAQALLAQDPGNLVGRLILALSQVFTGAFTAATEQELTALAADRSVRVEALRGLRDAALRRKDEPRALEMAEAIVAEKRANFPDWLTCAQLAARLQPERFDVLLAELTTQAGTDARALGRVAAWLRQSGRADRVEPWVASNEALKRDPFTARLIRAEMFAAQRDWEKLDALVGGESWRELEFFRLALRARVARGRNDEAAFSTAWRASVTAALANPDSARILADTVRTWPEFHEEFEEFLWRASQGGVQNAGWTLAELSGRAAARKDTRGLRRVSEAMCLAFPESAPAKNNLAFYSLLLGTIPDRAHRLAEELYAAHASDATIASTYALSLLRRGRGSEALAALEKLPADVLASSGLAVYHALALAAAGMDEKAKTRATQIPTKDLLPEEVELLREAGLLPKP